MSTTITAAFVADYEAAVHHLFQRMGGVLRKSVRTKDGVVGSTTTFNIIGKGSATTKSRHGTITPMNQAHTTATATIVDFYAGDFVDSLDEAKTKIDERDAIARGGAWALGRKVDDQIITALATTTEAAITMTITSAAAARNALLDLSQAADANDVPNDGMRYGLLTPKMWEHAMTVQAFASADYVGPGGLPLTEGAPLGQRWKAWNGVMWKVHTGLPGVGTASATCLLYHKSALGYATGAHPNNAAASEGNVQAIITYNGERDSWFVNHKMSGGAALIDTTGVIKGTLNDTTAVATS
jgi:hypothetical protein